MTEFFLLFCILATRMPGVFAQKATPPISTSSEKASTLNKSNKSEKNTSTAPTKKDLSQIPHDDTAHPRPEQKNENRSVWSRADQALNVPWAALEKKAQKNAAQGEAKREDRTARIAELKDQLASKNHPDPKKAQAELDKLRKEQTIGEKIETTSLYRYGDKQKAQANATAEREERIRKIQEELKGPISRLKKFKLETEQENLIKKRTLNEQLASSALFEKSTSTNAKLSNKIADHSTAIQIGGAALVGVGAMAAFGALAVGMGGMAAAKKNALNPSA